LKGTKIRDEEKDGKERKK